MSYEDDPRVVDRAMYAKLKRRLDELEAREPLVQEVIQLARECDRLLRLEEWRDWADTREQLECACRKLAELEAMKAWCKDCGRDNCPVIRGCEADRAEQRERAAVVKYLRHESQQHPGSDVAPFCLSLANIIESGEHVP